MSLCLLSSALTVAVPVLEGLGWTPQSRATGLHPLQYGGCWFFLPAGLIICAIRPAVPVPSLRDSASTSTLHRSAESPETLTHLISFVGVTRSSPCCLLSLQNETTVLPYSGTSVKQTKYCKMQILEQGKAFR